jgi:hypothetical protein
MKIFAEINIPVNTEVALLDLCLTLADDEKVLIATRAYAVTTITNICKTYPELLHDIHKVVKIL